MKQPRRIMERNMPEYKSLLHVPREGLGLLEKEAICPVSSYVWTDFAKKFKEKGRTLVDDRYYKENGEFTKVHANSTRI